MNELFYLYNKFSLAHETFDCSTILLNMKEIIKINRPFSLNTIQKFRNIDDSLIDNKKLIKKSRRKNIRNLKAVMRKLMKSKTYHLNSQFIELKNIEK